MKETIDYYNNNADWYYWTTVGLDNDKMRKHFASYLPAEASVIDLGCGSGRDVMAFSNMGHRALGLDASRNLVELAKERLEIQAVVGDMSSWRATSPYDGIWCCATLNHLNEKERDRFFHNLKDNLKPGGIIYISIKEGIETGFDKEGRFVCNCTEEELIDHLNSAGCEMIEKKTTHDSSESAKTKWVHVFARKTK